MKIDIVFDGPPSHEAGRFVEVENMDGKSIKVGDWIDRGNGLWALRIDVADTEEQKKIQELVQALRKTQYDRYGSCVVCGNADFENHCQDCKLQLLLAKYKDIA